MKHLKLLTVFSVFLLFIAIACEKEEMEPLPEIYTSDFGQLKDALVPAFYATYELYAGQDLDVGEVRVWNDKVNLYVQYVIDLEGWCLSETHLQVASELEGIPQKNDNPIPGKFDFKNEHECVTDFMYTVPIDAVWACSEVTIAAHAVVMKLDEDCMETVWQIGDVEVVNATTGWLENYADEFNWGDPAGPITLGPGLNVAQPSYANPFIVGTTPTNEFPYNSNFNKSYATNFDVQWIGELPYGGLLTVSWSPGQSAQEMKVISDGGINASFTATGTAISGKGWFLDTYPLVEHSADVGVLPYGEHTINFRHTQGDGTFWDWIRLEKPCVLEETAWGGELEFDGKNWATYFKYTIVCCQEAIYLSDGKGLADKGETTLNTVELNGGVATITPIFDFSSQGAGDDFIPEHFDLVNHIGTSPGGFYVYVIDEEEGYFGVYNVFLGTFTELGQLNIYPKGIVQVAVSPEGVLYVASKETNILYTVDLTTGALTAVGNTGVDIKGADMTFVPDGTLYLYTTDTHRLYEVDPSTGLASNGVAIGGGITGIATLPGTGTLLLSDTDNDILIEVNPDGTGSSTYSMGGFIHTWGDMASSGCGY